MNLFGLVIAIVYVFIISKIHEWVCKATRKGCFAMVSK